MASRASSRSTRPTISSTVRKPSCAMISRSSSAMNIMKLTTCSGLPSNFLRSTGSCVAMPTGQVLRWQTRIMMQPERDQRGAWRSRTPRRRAARRSTTSRPVLSWPSVSTRMRPRRSFITSTCCVSARPSSHGTPACLIEVSGEAPVPPSSPLISTTSALRLGDAGGDRADADLGDQLDADAGRGCSRSSGRG